MDADLAAHHRPDALRQPAGELGQRPQMKCVVARRAVIDQLPRRVQRQDSDRVKALPVAMNDLSAAPSTQILEGLVQASEQLQITAHAAFEGQPGRAARQVGPRLWTGWRTVSRVPLSRRATR
jgi:hypothetical protein